MFVAGSLSSTWQERLEDMIAVKEEVVDVLDQGKNCSEAWRQGYALAEELGHANNLMGMAPDQSRFRSFSWVTIRRISSYCRRFRPSPSNWRNYGY